MDLYSETNFVFLIGGVVKGVEGGGLRVMRPPWVVKWIL